MAKDKIKVKTLNTTLMVRPSNSHSKIDIARAIKMRANGASQPEIAKIFGVSASAVCQALAPYKDKLETLQQYSSNKDTFADMASHKVYRAILNKSDEDIESEKLSSLGAFIKTQHEISRLEQGKSSKNIAIQLVDLTQFQGDQQE